MDVDPNCLIFLPKNSNATTFFAFSIVFFLSPIYLEKSAFNKEFLAIYDDADLILSDVVVVGTVDAGQQEDHPTRPVLHEL